MKNIIEVKNLYKSYGAVRAVQDISFAVEEGSLFAFLGANGAGKSTTIDMLCTLLKPDSGQATIDGYILGQDDDKIRSVIGIVFQDHILDSLLTVRENLITRAHFYGLKGASLDEAVQKAASTAEALEFLNRPYGKLSGGQKRRADIARALVNTPRILFLDEPTTGLDPQTRKKIWRTIGLLRKESHMTVFLTTHYMEEAAQADYITIMGHGHILAHGRPLQLRDKYAYDFLRVRPSNWCQVKDILHKNNIAFNESDEIISIRLSDTLQSLPIVELIKDYIDNIEITNGTMDDVFLNVVGHEVLTDA